MPALATLPLNTHVRFCWAIACIPSSAAALVGPSSSCSSFANAHDAPFAQPLLAWAKHLYQIHPRVIRLDAAYWGLRLIAWIHAVLGAGAVIRLPSQASEEPLLSASHLDQRRTGKAQ